MASLISPRAKHNAMFYATEALLLNRDLSFFKHSAVITAFGQHFVKAGLLDPSLHRYLLDAFDLRNLGDYGAVLAVDDADAQQALDKAKIFCAAIKTYLVSPE